MAASTRRDLRRQLRRDDEPDQRIAFREGAFVETGFYPRHGCDAPLPAFSILGAGGFSIADAIAATAAGVLPAETAASCTEDKPEDVTVAIPLAAPDRGRARSAATQRDLDSQRALPRSPPTDPPDLAGRSQACAKIPQLGGDTGTDAIVQLVVATLPEESCRGITHYVLEGCDRGTLTCDVPDWDFTASPPAWWPCPVTAP